MGKFREFIAKHTGIGLPKGHKRPVIQKEVPAPKVVVPETKPDLVERVREGLQKTYGITATENEVVQYLVDNFYLNKYVAREGQLQEAVLAGFGVGVSLEQLSQGRYNLTLVTAETPEFEVIPVHNESKVDFSAEELALVGKVEKSRYFNWTGGGEDRNTNHL